MKIKYFLIHLSTFYFLPALFILGVAQDESLTVNDTSNPLEQTIAELDFKNTDLKDIVRILATKYRINIFVENDVRKKLTLHLVNVKLADALQFIVEDNDLLLKQFGAIYKIMNLPDPPAPPKKWHIEFSEGLLSVDFRNEDIQETLYQISKVTGKTILPERNVNGSISGLINALPFDEGLSQLLKINGYYFKKEQSAYHVRRSITELNEQNLSARPFWIHIDNGKIDMELNNAPLHKVLDEIALQTKADFFLLTQPEEIINARVTGLTLEESLNFILMPTDNTFKKSGDVYIIGDKSNQGLLSSQLIKLKHLKVDGIMEMLPQNLIQRAELKIIKEHNALLVNGPQTIITEIENIIQDMDRPIPQIFFEALVVDFKSFDVKDFSVEAGIGKSNNSDSSGANIQSFIPGLNIFRTGKDINYFLDKVGRSFMGINIGQLPDDFYIRIKALEQVGKANIRSKPQISTLNGHTAELKIGETRYFKLISETPIRDPNEVYIQTTERFQTVEINISLNITPWVSASGEITVEIKPEFNTPGEQVSAGIPPNIQSRSLNSTVRLRDGETIILGGLIQEIDNETISRVPILGSIPLLGKLFSNTNHNKTKSELIIYVTPHLSYSEDWLEMP